MFINGFKVIFDLNIWFKSNLYINICYFLDILLLKFLVIIDKGEGIFILYEVLIN